MAEPILTPDGKHYWDGSNWIPVDEYKQQIQLNDSVVMGGIRTETNISINKSDNKAKISNYCDLYIYRISKSDIQGAKDVLELSKHTDLKLTEEIFKNTRLIEVSEQVLYYVKSKVISFVGLTKGFVENKMDAIQSGHEIVAPVVELMKNHVEDLLNFRSDKVSWDMNQQVPHKIEYMLMEFKQLGLILFEAIQLLQSVSEAILKSPAVKISSLLSYQEISDLKLQLISMTHFNCRIDISHELSNLFQQLPDAKLISDEVRLDSLKNELINLKNEIFTVENQPIRITPMMYSGVLISGDVQLLYQFKELREDLGSIILHVDVPVWNELKNTQIHAEGYSTTVACWMGSKNEIMEAINLNSISQNSTYSFNDKQQFRIMLEAIYNVGSTLGKLKKLFRPAWGKVDRLSGKFYYELCDQMETVYNMCRTTRYGLRILLSESDWEEIHSHPEIIKVKQQGLNGEKDYKIYDKPIGSAPGDVSCFIATAAYGSELHWKIDILRYWRDFHLRKSKFGRLFINVYYRLSPKVSSFISHYTILKSFTRILLYPIVTLVSIRIGKKNVNKI